MILGLEMKFSLRAKVVILTLCLVALSGTVYTLRYDFGQWVLSFPPLKGYVDREIHQILKKEIAPRLKTRINLNFFQKLGVALLEKRNEEERKRDAIEAVDRFIREELKKGKLRVMLVKKLRQIDPGAVKKHEVIIKHHTFVLVWKGNSEEELDVVAAFSLSFWKGLSVKEKKGNEKARFFARVSTIAEEAARGD